MALTRWILALCGYARLEVCGVHPERVLNACAAAGIACTASEPVDAYTLRITVRARCAETAAELARRCQCEVKTLYRRGLPQLLRRAARYRGACAGLLVAVLAVLTSSLFIWRIDVTGNETLTTGQILRCLDECGVRPGTYWPALSNDLVRNDMILCLPELRWLTVNVHGSRAEVIVREKDPLPDITPDDTPVSIYASATGVILSMDVYAGEARVVPGACACVRRGHRPRRRCAPGVRPRRHPRAHAAGADRADRPDGDRKAARARRADALGAARGEKADQFLSKQWNF